MISKATYMESASNDRLMTVEQSTVLNKKRNELILKAGLSALVIGACIFGLVLQAQASEQVGYYAIALGIFVMTAFIGMDVVDLLLAIQQDLTLNRIAQAQGYITPQTTHLYDVLTGQHAVAIGERRYKALQKINAEYGRVIYAPYSRIVLGVEV